MRDAIEGWLAYGAALNEGRALFPSDAQFGKWKEETVLGNLPITPNAKEDQAAMWAAANADHHAARKKQGVVVNFRPFRETGVWANAQDMTELEFFAWR